MKAILLITTASLVTLAAGQTAEAGGGIYVGVGYPQVAVYGAGYGGAGYSAVYSGYGAYPAPRYAAYYGGGWGRGPVRAATWHDTSHYDYHPGGFQRHRNHYHYVPGHYDYHQDGHWDHH